MASAADSAHIGVVFNPVKPGLNQVRDAVERITKIHGFAATRWYASSAVDSGAEAAKRALSEGARAVIAVGGDGTVRGVAAGLRHSGVPLAIVPQGTGNILARNIGVPKSLEAQITAAFEGTRYSVDLGVAEIERPNGTVDSEIFLVLAGMGLDARMISTTNAQLKKNFGWLAYVDAGARSIMLDKPLHLTIKADDLKPMRREVFSLMVGNCGLLPGGVLLIPDALIDDGKLDAIGLLPTTKQHIFSWLAIWRKVVWENGVLRRTAAGRRIIDLLHDTRNVMYKQVKSLHFTPDNPEILQLDGEDFGLAKNVKTTVDKGALVLCTGAGWRSGINLFGSNPPS